MFYKKIILSLVLLISLFDFRLYGAEIGLSDYLTFNNGDSLDKLLWITEPDGTPNIGTLQCPMAFVTISDGKTWVADTQNARLCLFSKSGKNLKEIDLIKLGKKAGLSDPPAIADICVYDNIILAADAASNSVLEINIDTQSLRIFKSPETDKGRWFQISHIYTDKEKRIYIDDIALGKIIILDKNGKYLGENIASSIAVSRIDSRMASIHYIEETQGEADASYYQITVNNGFATPWIPIANVNSDEDKVIYINIIGIDNNNDIYVVYETENNRYYKVFSMNGELKKSFVSYPVIPFINPARPDWIDDLGNIYTVLVSGKVLKVMKFQQ